MRNTDACGIAICGVHTDIAIEIYRLVIHDGARK